MEDRSETLPLHHQGPMDPESSSASSVAWSWFIGWLAEKEDADTRTLRDAAKDMPEPGLSGNAFEYARELLSLRCLEGLVKLDNYADDDARSGSKIRLDLNQRCSVALLRITTDEAGISCLDSGDDLGVSKWGIKSYIEHKRAQLQRCSSKPAMEIIAQMIDAGTDPAALLSESRLINAVFESDAKGVSLTCDAASHHQVAIGSEQIVNLMPQIGNGADSSQYRRNKEGSYMEKVVDVRSNVKKSTEDYYVCNNPPFMVSDNGVRVSNQHGIISPHKDDGADTGKEPQNIANQTEKYSDMRIHDDQDFHTARDNQKPESDISQVAISLNVPSEEFRDVIKPPDVPDAPSAAICKNPQTVIPVVDEINITNKTRNQNVDGGLVGESVAMTARYGFQNNRESFRVEDIPSNIEKYHNKEVDVTSWKNNLLSSQNPTFDGAEPALCMMCNKSGPLLCCSSGGCPYAVHENCLGCAPFYMDGVNFRCPFCACSRATAEYLKAKKKVQFRKKELIAYLSSSNWCKFSQSLLKKRHLEQEQEDPSYPIKRNGIAERTETHRNQARNVDHVDVSPEIMEVDVVNATHKLPGVCVDVDLPLREVNYQVTGHADPGVVDDPPVIFAEDILPPGEKNSTTNSDTCQLGDDLAQQPQPSGEIEHQNNLAIVLYTRTLADPEDPIYKKHSEVQVKPVRAVRTDPAERISKPTPNKPNKIRKRKVPWTSREEEKLKVSIWLCIS
uniref:Zinc finger PHD-type domain-containing protein n=1 Tax=Kalanchoe fedtschenkoi TaxID=63787 RepID=A0A7N0VIL9_KALFE